VNAEQQSVFGYTVASSGALQLIPGAGATGTGPLAVAIDPGEKFVYITNTLQNTLSIFSINSSTGALTTITGSPFLTGTNPTSVAVTPSGAYLYVANLGSNNVTA